MHIKHRDNSSMVRTRVEKWGFTPDIQQRIGALMVVWGIFETQLEVTIWALRGEQVAGKRPSTDGRGVTELIRSLGQETQRFGSAIQGLLRSAVTAADDLRDYRHSLVHGYMIPSADMLSFLRNPSWHGELRKRPSGEAFISENLLDMALDTAWTLCQVVIAVRRACAESVRADDLLAFEADVARARSQANELRHLAALVTNEKY